MKGKTFTFTDPDAIRIAEALSDDRVTVRLPHTTARRSDEHVVLFAFTEPDAANIAYLVQRNHGSPQRLAKILAFAQSLEARCRKATAKE